LLFAALVTVHVFLLMKRVTTNHSHRPQFTRPAVLLGVLLLLQLILGTVSYLAKFTTILMPIDASVIITTTHLVVGALMLMASLVITLRSYRYPTVLKSTQIHDALAEQYSS
jgi:hypothetical protein